MLECYCDVPNIDFPFTAEDIFGDYELDLFNNNVPVPQELIISGKSVKWNNWMAQEYAGKKSKEAFEVYQRENIFNGAAVISDTKMKHDVWDWMNATFQPDVFQKIWNDGLSSHPPVSILCFSDSTGWHKEGPIDIPNEETIPKENAVEIIKRMRAPAVINFRLLGDIDGSVLQFAKPSEQMLQNEKELIDKFFTLRPEESFITKIVEHNTMNISATQHWLADRTWHKDLTPITEHKGMHNAYVVNLGQWHRVLTNGSPRVSFRVHANNKFTFKEIEERVEAGKFFK